ADAPSSASIGESITSTPTENAAVAGVRVTARTRTPAATSSATSGRPTLPVAPVTTIVIGVTPFIVLIPFIALIPSCWERRFTQPSTQDGPEAGKVTVGIGNFFQHRIVDDS